MRTLLVGLGEVGLKHAEALLATPFIDLRAVIDPGRISGPTHRFGDRSVATYPDLDTAIDVVGPQLVVIAIPPGVALESARSAARAGATVLVEKPAAIAPVDLAREAHDERIFVGFQTHFAPCLTSVFREPCEPVHASIRLRCRRDEHYYRDWRGTYDTAGGILHQQAIHGLALAARLWPPQMPSSCTARTINRRPWKALEDQITADVRFPDGHRITVDAAVDSLESPEHSVELLCASGHRRLVRGRNLESGFGEETIAPSHTDLRQLMYGALRDVHLGTGRDARLYPLAELTNVMHIIDYIYQCAEAIIDLSEVDDLPEQADLKAESAGYKSA